MFECLREDVRTAIERDPAARSTLEVVCCYAGLHALWFHRVAHSLWKHRALFLARVMAHVGRFMTAIEIHPGAHIGRRFFIDHGAGVVIGETAEIGDDVTMYQGVVLGGVSLEKKKRHPTLGNGVVVGASAVILGPIVVGEGGKVGAGSVVLHDVPPYTTVVGVPARPAGEHIMRECVDLNHHAIPDPVRDAIDSLSERVTALEGEMTALKDSPQDAEAAPDKTVD